MLKKAFAHLFGLNRGSQREASRNRELARAHLPLNFRLELKDISVRIVFAGGQEELYEYSVPASHLMEKYPGMCVARSEVFRNPEDSLLRPDENLLPGHKYLIIPSTSVWKLKSKHMEKPTAKGICRSRDETSDVNVTWEAAEDISDDSVCSAKDFYVTRSRSSRSLGTRRSVKAKKPFVPPLPKSRSFKGLVWEPSLTSVQELSMMRLTPQCILFLW